MFDAWPKTEGWLTLLSPPALFLSLSLCSFRDLTTIPRPFDLARCPTAVQRETSGTTTPTCTSTWPNLIRRESRTPWSAWKQGKDGVFPLLCRPAHPCALQTMTARLGACLLPSCTFSRARGQGGPPCWGLLFVNLMRIQAFLLSCVKQKANPGHFEMQRTCGIS